MPPSTAMKSVLNMDKFISLLWKLHTLPHADASHADRHDKELPSAGHSIKLRLSGGIDRTELAMSAN